MGPELHAICIGNGHSIGDAVIRKYFFWKTNLTTTNTVGLHIVENIYFSFIPGSERIR